MPVASAVLAATGLVLFSMLMLAQHKQAAIGILSTLLVISGLLFLYHQLMEHVVEGVDLVIDACKYAPITVFVDMSCMHSASSQVIYMSQFAHMSGQACALQSGSDSITCSALSPRNCAC